MFDKSTVGNRSVGHDETVRCLVTGATGYVGGRLVPRLLAAGHEVRCLTRYPQRLRDVPWADRVEVVQGDVATGAGLDAALEGVDVLFYLVHALGQPDRAEVERRSARFVAAAALRAGVARIVHLARLEPADHKGSETEAAEIFLASGVPTVVFRAAMIIGSGSASFEMLRHLGERLPVMLAPRWLNARVQPIAIRDVLRYLVWSVEAFPLRLNRTFDVGGPDVLTYARLMQRYARAVGLRRRLLLPAPCWVPRFSAYWVSLVTPVPTVIARQLVSELRYGATCGEHDIAEFIPDPDHPLTGVDQAIELALRKIRDGQVETRWANAVLPGAPSDPLPSDPDWCGRSYYTDARGEDVDAPRERLWQVIEAIGGERGLGPYPLAWSARRLRRGRRDPHRLYVGEVLDFWRVEEIVPGELLRLRAEMRLPGRAWLELRALPGRRGGSSRYEQRAVFLPRGLTGHLYWTSLAPVHALVFDGMARNIADTAER
jgi:uncharacterized protein YbjT (DUF2867 family)